MNTGAAPTRGVAPRWGIGDAVVVWVLGLMAGALAQAPFIEGKCIPQSNEDVATFVSLVLQTSATVLILLYTARARGRGSLQKDFGFIVRFKDAPFLLVGLGVALLSTGILEPITELGDINKGSQDVRRIFDQSTGAGLGLLILAVLVLAPMGEELLFRGVLQRSLQRRVPSWQAIFLAALTFAFVHVALDFGAGFGVPALLLLGLVSGWRAVQTRSLSQSIWLHSGFNLLAVLARIFDETLKFRSRCGR